MILKPNVQGIQPQGWFNASIHPHPLGHCVEASSCRASIWDSPCDPKSEKK